MIRKQLIAGNTTPIMFVHFMGDTATDLPDGYDLKVGFYRPNGSEILVFSWLGGNIVHSGHGIYHVLLTHEMTRHFYGVVMMDAVVLNEHHSFVKHCSDTVVFDVVQRKMNKIIKP